METPAGLPPHGIARPVESPPQRAVERFDRDGDKWAPVARCDVRSGDVVRLEGDGTYIACTDAMQNPDGGWSFGVSYRIDQNTNQWVEATDQHADRDSSGNPIRGW